LKGSATTLRRRWAFALLSVLALAWFTLRGPARAPGDSQDLAVVWGSSRAWLAGLDPYDADATAAAFLAGGGPARITPGLPLKPVVSPSASFPAFAVLGVLPWAWALPASVASTVALSVIALAALGRAAGLDGRRAVLLVLLGLSLAPVHTTISHGQPVAASVALLILGWIVLGDRPALAGALMACGAALKPSLSGAFALVGLLGGSRRWVVSAGATFLAFFGIGELRLRLAGHEGLPAWLRALSASTQHGVNSASPENPGSAFMLNLELPLRRLVDAPVTAQAIAVAIVLPMLLVASWKLWTDSSRRTGLRALSLLSVLSLLVMYHRFYDAVLLWLPLAVLLSDWDELGAWPRWLLAASLAVFSVNGQALLQAMVEAGRVPGWAASTVLWRTLVMPHHPWTLLLLALGLTAWLLRAPGPAASGPPPRDEAGHG
jgi:hypothetical protein